MVILPESLDIDPRYEALESSLYHSAP
jgi:hypothetical protein